MTFAKTLPKSLPSSCLPDEAPSRSLNISSVKMPMLPISEKLLRKQESIKSRKGRVLDVLDMVKEVIDSDPFSLNPKPIGPHGVQQVVENVDISDNTWVDDEAVVGHLCSLLPVSAKRKIGEPSEHLRQKKQKRTGTAVEEKAKALVREAKCAVESSCITRVNSGELSAHNQHRFRSYQSEQWGERFQDLIEFRKVHGHCLVPHKWSENLTLAQWVKRQRYQYKLKQNGLHTTMTDKRQTALEELGFVWDSHAAVWEERLNELKSFKEKHGHCNVPSTFPENPPLAIWVKCQRRQYKLFVNEKRSNITQERITKLDLLGFEWNPRNLKIIME